PPQSYTLFPYTTLFRSKELEAVLAEYHQAVASIPFGNDQLAAAKAAKLAEWSDGLIFELDATKFDRATVLRILRQIASIEPPDQDRKSTRLNSSHQIIS